MADTPGHYVTGFSSSEWTGNALKDSGSIWFGTGFIAFLLCLLLMIFIPPLRSVSAVLWVCNVTAVLAMIATIVGNVQREKRSLTKMTDQTNAFMAEVTGDPNARITRGRMQSLIVDKKRGLELQINGVPGLEIKAVPKDEKSTQVRAILTRPDYGLQSFDVLLEAEAERTP
ncbi:hypothetical protein AB4Y72_16470 [Arthrobacter sp. YAF34]|uniref:hypothetical protein n=1 Tax=Arthrobacter sp. YAF34 TaxID=3233083 RepID=UPI003F8E9ACC